MFEFGKNWESFSKVVNEERLEASRRSLSDLVGEENIKGRSFLDIGCGSGLFSIAAAQLGAAQVMGIDVDKVSVETSIANAEKWLPEADIQFRQASVLDESQMELLGKFDIVYSWGVLHHTGNMQQAIELSAERLKPGGLFVIAIYNRHVTSSTWLVIKRIYNILPPFTQKLMALLFTPIIFLAKALVTLRNPLTMKRGMDFYHNVVDWVGGYPYEYASITELSAFLESRGITVKRVVPADVPIGCNEFVCTLKA